MLDANPNATNIDAYITSPETTGGSPTPVGSEPSGSSTPVAASPDISSAIAADSQSLLATPATAQQAAVAQGLDPSIAQHLQNNWQFPQEQIAQFQNPNQVVDYAFQALQRQQQELEQQRAQYQQELAYYHQQMAAQQQQSQQSAQPAAAPAAKQNAWQPPEFNQDWMRVLRRNKETGLLEPIAPGAVNMDIVNKANAYLEFQNKWQTEFANNPYEFINKGLGETLTKIKQEAIEEAKKEFMSFHEKQQQDLAVYGILNQNRSWMNQRDASGNVMRDANGHPLLTPAGNAYVTTLKNFHADPELSGLSPQKQNELAIKLSQIQTTQAAPPAAEIPHNRLSQYLGSQPNVNAAMHNQSRNGANAANVQGQHVSGASQTFSGMIAPLLSEHGHVVDLNPIRTL